MHYLKLKKPLAFIDLETTGLSTTRDRIVEMAVVKALPDGSLDSKSQRINPERPIPTETSLIHGIYDEDVREAPTFKQVAREYLKYLEGCDLSGFNILKFDLPVLVEEFQRVGIDFDLSKRRLIDSQRIFHLMEPRNLTAAYRHYCRADLNDLGKGAHNAEADALASYHVLMAQVERHEGQTIRDVFGNESTPVHNDPDKLHAITAHNLVDLAGRMKRTPEGTVIFAFGKHKNKLVSEVLTQEPAYYDWIMNGDFPTDTKRCLTAIKLDMVRQKFRS